MVRGGSGGRQGWKSGLSGCGQSSFQVSSIYRKDSDWCVETDTRESLRCKGFLASEPKVQAPTFEKRRRTSPTCHPAYNLWELDPRSPP